MSETENSPAQLHGRDVQGGHGRRAAADGGALRQRVHLGRRDGHARGHGRVRAAHALQRGGARAGQPQPDQEEGGAQGGDQERQRRRRHERSQKGPAAMESAKAGKLKKSAMKSVDAEVALRDAITKGNLRGVKRTLKSGADVERVDERGWTPIMLAAKVGYVAILRLFVMQKHLADFRLAAAKRAKRLAKYIGDAVPAVAMRNQVKALRVLLNEFKADVNARYLNGVRPLMVTASHGHEDAIKFFLENGAGIEAKTEDGITAFHLAVLNGTADVVEVL
ncbi:hypothetical protein ON010_g9135 [Phytophthora cinnamomi]|nr:hypothetical protein ON010_g9135 [Phytophthora cinnamomi]